MKYFIVIWVIFLVSALHGCCPQPLSTISTPSPYDAKWEEWNTRYQSKLISRCIQAGHIVVSYSPVRCLGPNGEYIP